jgi:hypothetical protein
MADNADQLSTVRGLAKRLANCSFDETFEQAMAGFAVGAAFSLERALSLGWSDQSRPQPGQPYHDELIEVAADIANGDVPTQQRWLAGYYFNSALLRLSALGDHVAVYVSDGLRDKWALQDNVRDDVNLLKHDMEKHLSDGLKSKVTDAIEALTMAVAVLDVLLNKRFKKGSR